MENNVTSAQRFESNSELKNWWLNTRKKKRKYGDVELPGMFQTYSYSGDAFAFLLIIILELWGLYNFWLLVDQLIYTIALFFADALLAIGSHIWTKKACLAKNRLALAKYGIIYMATKNPKEEIEIEKNKLKKYRFFSGIFKFLILALAVFKIFSFLGNYEGGLNGLSITIILSYLLVAALHIRSTGYFLSELIRKYRSKRQYNIHLNSDDLTDFTISDRREFNVYTYRKENFEKLQDLTQQLNYTKKHDGEIKLENVGTRRHHVLENNVIKSYGILNDDDLQNLIEGQKNVKQKECLAIYGLMHQLDILDAAIFRPEGVVRPPISDIPVTDTDSNDQTPLNVHHMKNNTIVIFVFSAIMLSQISCVDRKDDKDIESFPLQIILTNKLMATPNEGLPSAIDSLFLPIEPTNCPKTAFLPDVELVRYGLSKEYRTKIETENKNWKTFFQKFYGNTGLNSKKRNILDALKNFSINDSLEMKNIENFIERQALSDLIEIDTKASFIILNPEYAETSVNINTEVIPVSSKLEDLQSQLSSTLCNSKDLNKKVVVFYNPDLVITQVSDSVDKPPVEPDEEDQEPPDPIDDEDKVYKGTITYPNGDVYVGELINGRPNGLGILTFKKSRIISKDDIAKQKAEVGDKLDGRWKNGEPQAGRLYDSTGAYKTTIIIGGE